MCGTRTSDKFFRKLVLVETIAQTKAVDRITKRIIERINETLSRRPRSKNIQISNQLKHEDCSRKEENDQSTKEINLLVRKKL